MLEYIKRASVANAVSAIVLVVGVVYAVLTRNDELLKALVFIAAGYLFGVTRGGGGGGGEHRG